MSFLKFIDPDLGKSIVVALAEGVSPADGAASIVPSGVPYTVHQTRPETPGQTVEELRAQATLPRDQFAERAAEAGLITWAEASAWAAGTTLPAVEQAALMSVVPVHQRDKMRFDMLARPSVRRDNVSLEAMRVARGMTHAQVDALFGIAI